jgi:NADH dehydrogenase
LSLRGHPEVFLAGDMALIGDPKTGEPLPQLGSVAQQSGHRAGENIALLAADRPSKPFEYRDKGTMAMIGRGHAVVQMRSGRTLTGRPAFMAWRAVHLMLLKGGEQKAGTLLEWGKSYLRRASA